MSATQNQIVDYCNKIVAGKVRGILAKPGSVVELRQSHFARGSVIIAPDFYCVSDPQTGEVRRVEGSTRDTVFRLAEDVSFDPNPPAEETAEAVWAAGDPTPEQFAPAGVYDPHAFGIGFFAAVVMYARDAVLDLGGHTLSHSARHRLLQRFCAGVELSSTPFAHGTGPHNFGPVMGARGCGVVNGTIRGFSHHGVHGNDANEVLISNLTIADYEVAGVHLNSSRGVAVVDVSLSSSRSVPVLGTFSAARFLRPYVDACEAAGSRVLLRGASHTASTVRAALRDSVFNVYSDLVTRGLPKIDRSTNGLKEWSLYNNEAGVVDGTAYGIVINGKGPAVLGFPEYPVTMTEFVLIKNVAIDGQFCHVNETPALICHGSLTQTSAIDENKAYSSSRMMKDPVAAVFQVQNADADGAPVTVDAGGAYVGNPLADAQVLVAAAVSGGDVDFGSLSTKRNTIDANALDFAAGAKTLFTDLGDGFLLGSFVFNGDSMFHVNKGCIGMKLDAGKNVVVDDCRIFNVQNSGAAGLTHHTLPVPVPGTSAVNEEYCDRRDVSHPDASYYGYGGADVRGVSMASSKNVFLNNVFLSGVKSHHGKSLGVDIHMNTDAVVFNGVRVTRVSAGTSVDNLKLYRGNPTSAPVAWGVSIGADSRNISISRLESDNHTSPVETSDIVCKTTSVVFAA